MRRRAAIRRGMTLLELTIATTMLAVLMTSLAVVFRTGRLAWEAHEGDYKRIEAAHATLRHVVRRIRQADAVTSITGAADPSGKLTVVMPNGDIETWDHDNIANTVNFGINTTTPTELLATEITGLTFTGFRADGTTQTGVPAEVQCVRVDVDFQLPRDTGGNRTVRCWAWVRSW